MEAAHSQPIHIPRQAREGTDFELDGRVLAQQDFSLIV
jgi:hypothetical protein